LTAEQPISSDSAACGPKIAFLYTPQEPLS
jgi:hypothetical protein